MVAVHFALDTDIFPQSSAAVGFSVEAFTNRSVGFAGLGVGTMPFANSFDFPTAYYSSSNVLSGDLFGPDTRTPTVSSFTTAIAAGVDMLRQDSALDGAYTESRNSAEASALIEWDTPDTTLLAPFIGFGGTAGSEADLGVAATGWPVLAVGTGLTFTLRNTGGVTAGSQAEAGFFRAAALWSSYLSDPVNIRLDVGFRSLDQGVLASAGSNRDVVSYSALRSALVADGMSPSDATAVASLAAGPSLSFYTNNVSGTRIFDNDGSANNTYFDVNSANLKALGIAVDYKGVVIDDGVTADANITFSSNIPFDFSPDDGISPGALDFVGIAFHEIGHALGFVSGVDTVDYNSGRGPIDLDLNSNAVFSALDLFRYNSNGVRDLSFGSAAYFSINGGAANSGLFSTGKYNGDLEQASHWKDNSGLGIMDPTSTPAGRANVITNLDILAMDVIGWNLNSTGTGSGDDYADSLTDTKAPFGLVRVGGSALGNVEVAGDRDVFATTLTAGQTYTFSLRGSASGGGPWWTPTSCCATAQARALGKMTIRKPASTR